MIKLIRDLYLLIFVLLSFLLFGCSDNQISSSKDQSSSELSGVADNFYQLALVQTDSEKGLFEFQVCFASVGSEFLDNETCVPAFRDSKGKPLVIPSFIMANNPIQPEDIRKFHLSGVAKTVTTASMLTGFIVYSSHLLAKSSIPTFGKNIMFFVVALAAASFFVPGDLFANLGITLDFQVMWDSFREVLSSGIKKGKEVAEEAVKLIDNPAAYNSKGSSVFKPSIFGFAQSETVKSWSDIITEDNAIGIGSQFSYSAARIPDVLPQLAKFLTMAGWTSQSSISQHCLPFFSSSSYSIYSGCLPVIEKWQTGIGAFYSTPKLDDLEELELYDFEE